VAFPSWHPPDPGALAGATMPGAYLLVLALDARLALPVPRHGGGTLPAGVHAYAGSARGPGGIRARVRRHLRTEKPVHWHIDRVRAHARVLRVGVWPHGRECTWIAALLGAGAHAPLPGLGSSDCRRCPAHLVQMPEAELTPRVDPSQ